MLSERTRFPKMRVGIPLYLYYIQCIILISSQCYIQYTVGKFLSQELKQLGYVIRIIVLFRESPDCSPVIYLHLVRFTT